MSRLDRYFVREILPPLGVGLVLFVVVVAFAELLRLADAVTGLGLGLGDFVSAFIYSLPPLLGLLLPIGGLFAVMLAFGRLGADGELTALAAAGVGPRRLLRIPLIVGGVLMTLTAIALILGEPWGIAGLRRVLTAGAQRALVTGIEPGRFYHWVDDVTMRVRDKRGAQLRGVIIVDNTHTDHPVAISAREGHIATSSANRDVVFNLNQGRILFYGKGNNHRIGFDKGTYRLNIDALMHDKLLHVTKAQGMPLGALWKAQFDMTRKPKGRAVAAVTFHRKIALPIAALIFALLAVPLGGRAVGCSRARALIYSAVLVGGYYYLGRTFEMWGRSGAFFPGFAPWIPNVLGIILFLLLLRRMSKATP